MKMSTNRVWQEKRRRNLVADLIHSDDGLLDLPDNQPFTSAHVCEAPGAFICATHFYQNLRYEAKNARSSRPPWKWTGLSLNPYYEGNDPEAMVDDDRLIVETLDHWYFGRDNSGNILDPVNIKGLWSRVRVSLMIQCSFQCIHRYCESFG